MARETRKKFMRDFDKINEEETEPKGAQKIFKNKKRSLENFIRKEARES
jgi:hypothetical protein